MKNNHGVSEVPVRDRLGLWNLYFAVKFYLYFRGYASFDLVMNTMFFFGLVLISNPAAAARRLIRLMLNLAALAAGFLILWHDSWLPSFSSEFAYLRQYGMPTFKFLAEFFGQSLFTPEALAATVVILLLAAFMLNRRKIQFSWLIFTCLIAVGVRQAVVKPAYGLDARLDAFYRHEAGRRVKFEAAKADAGMPDVIILQICSLAQDDLHSAGLESDPFWKTFDIMLTNFNTVTPHSGPSAIRLLRSQCGQLPHAAIYRESPGECFLLDNMRSIGYRTYSIMDHDGIYEDFSENLIKHAHMDKPITVTDMKPAMTSFDGSPIFDDTAVLERWWNARVAGGARHAAVFANIISLHTGAHSSSEKEWWRKSSAESYRERFAALAKSIYTLENDIEKSGRRAIIILVPEHGAALRGTSMQMKDLRELPLPYITVAPVGIKFIGWKKPEGVIEQARVNKLTSYLSLAYLISGIMKNPQIAVDQKAEAALIAGLPEIQFVAENQAAVLINDNGGYYIKTSNKKWAKIPKDTMPWGRSEQ